MADTYTLVNGQPTIRKDPQAVLDYSEDWSAWLAKVSGDTIVDAVWTVSAGLTKGSETFSTTGATVWLSGGTVSDTPESATCHITTVAGRQDDRTIYIQIAQR